MKLVPPAHKARKEAQGVMEYQEEQGEQFKENKEPQVYQVHVVRQAIPANVLLNASKQWVKRMRFTMHVLKETRRDHKTYEL